MKTCLIYFREGRQFFIRKNIQLIHYKLFHDHRTHQSCYNIGKVKKSRFLKFGSWGLIFDHSEISAHFESI